MNTNKNLFRKVMWFGERLKFDIDFLELLQPRRKVSKKKRYKSGLFYSEKCQRDIQYESGLELAFFKRLEEMKQVRFYWEQPVRIPYRQGRRKETYTPDVAPYLRTKEIILVEIKNLKGMLDYEVQTKAEAMIEYCHKKGFGFLITDGQHSIDKIRQTKSNRKFETALLKAVENGTLLNPECRYLMRDYEASQNELLKAILKFNLKFNPFPLPVGTGNKNDLFHQVFYQKKKYQEIADERFSQLFNRINFHKNNPY